MVRLLAVASMPAGGLKACGIWSKGTVSTQSKRLLSPGTGSSPFPLRRKGIRPMAW